MKVDWSAVRARLAATQTRLEQPLEQGTQASAELLQQRAAVLAQEPLRGPAPSELLEVLEFSLAHEHYAVELAYVDQVQALRAWTPLPGTPPYLPGIVNVRGRVFSLMDLKCFFDLPQRALVDTHKVIIVHHAGLESAILTDAIIGMRSLAIGALQAPLPTLTGRRRNYLRGLVDGRLIVLDLPRLLADPALIVAHDDAN